MIWSKVLWLGGNLVGAVSAQYSNDTTTPSGGDNKYGGERTHPSSTSSACPVSTVTVSANCEGANWRYCEPYCNKYCTPVTSTTTTTTTETTTCYITIRPRPSVSTKIIYVHKTIEVTVTATDYETELSTITTSYPYNVTIRTTDEKTSTITDYETSVSTITTSIPYNVTITNSYGYPVVITKWKTITETTTLTVPTTTTATEYSTTTYTTTTSLTLTTSYPYTVVNNVTSYKTTTYISVSIFNATTTVSYPVTATVTNVSPVTTTAFETESVTVSLFETVTKFETTEILITIPPKTITTSISGSLTTITIPASTMVSISTLPAQTIVIPASTVTSTITTILPGVPTTITLDGTTLTSTLPGVTFVRTTTITADAETQTIIGPGTTVTVIEAAICPAPTNTGPVTPQDTGPNALWGCSPGYVCNVPKPAGCQLWTEPPKYDYLCDIRYCILSPPFSPVVWPNDEVSYYPPPAPGYFNLNPKAFGLDYGIFVKKIIVTYTIKHGSRLLATYTTGNWASQPSLTHYPPGPTPKLKIRAASRLQKRDSTIVPAVCFAQCNNCYIEAQRVGKSPALCEKTSAFQTSYGSCQECVELNGDTTKVSLQTYVDPQFAPFVNFCNAQPAQSQIAEPSTTSRTSTAVPVSETQSLVETTKTTAPSPTETAPTTQTTESISSGSTPSIKPTITQPTQTKATTSAIGKSTTTANVPAQVTGGSNRVLASQIFVVIFILVPLILALLS